MGAPDLRDAQKSLQPLTAETFSAKILDGPPLIAPARQYVFPLLVPGEEEAMARGSIWVEVKPKGTSAFLAQFAAGFTTAGVANGLWRLPGADQLLAVSGGYAYRMEVFAPEKTEFLAQRPVVQVLAPEANGSPLPEFVVLVGYHDLMVLDGRGEAWRSSRISWEGITVTALEGDLLRGTGWDMMADEEVPFALDLRSRMLTGGGYRAG